MDLHCIIPKNAGTSRANPSNFPSWRTARYYFDLWARPSGKEQSSLLEQALKNRSRKRVSGLVDTKKTTFGIVDANSVKNMDTALEKGYDTGKKVSHCRGQ
ncbi:MAG: hypothetical protein NVSMB6_06820 [Burkholderiaceae bacterium]